MEQEPKQKTGWFGSKGTDSKDKNVDEPAKKAGWFGSNSNNSETKEEESAKKSGWSGSKVSNGVQKSETPAWKRRAQVDEAEEERKFEQELVELERKAVEKAKSSLKAPRLNIEKNPRPIVESEKQKEVEVMLVKQLCGAYKAEVKLDEKAAAAREEKKKDLEVVRSARYHCCTFTIHTFWEISFKETHRSSFKFWKVGVYLVTTFNMIE